MANVLPIIRRAWWLLHSSPQVHSRPVRVPVQVPFPAAQLEYFKRKSPGFESRARGIDWRRSRRCRRRGCGPRRALWVQNLCCAAFQQIDSTIIETDMWLICERAREWERRTESSHYSNWLPHTSPHHFSCPAPPQLWVTIGHCTLRHKFRLFLKWPEPATLLCLAWVCVCVRVLDCLTCGSTHIYFHVCVCACGWLKRRYRKCYFWLLFMRHDEAQPRQTQPIDGDACVCPQMLWQQQQQ